MTVARGMGGEGSRQYSQRSYDRWALGEGGEGQGQGQGGKGRKGGGGGGKGGWVGLGQAGPTRGVGGGGEGRGARQARHFGPVEPTTLGQSGPSFWAHLAHHLGPSGPPSIKPVGWPRAFKKKFGLARPIDFQRAYRPSPNRAAGLT